MSFWMTEYQRVIMKILLYDNEETRSNIDYWTNS